MIRLYVIILCGLLAACAQQSSPSGGDKDILPPQPLSFTPQGFHTGFKESKFTIEFDEYIQVQGFSEQLIISPPLDNVPEYRIRGKSLEISWEDSLMPNTTYQFNFGKSIIDLNEGNINSDLKYVFSTGDYIDSLMIYGRVQNSSDNEPVAEAAVMIYTSFEDSLPQTTAPEYFALTDANGKFQLSYLPPNDYKIFVLQEENNNYLYDGPPEKIAFIDTLVTSSSNDSTAGINFMAFIESDTSQYVASSKGRDFGRYDVIFNVAAKNPSISFFDTETMEPLEAMSFLNERRDSLKNWVTLPQRDNMEEVTVIVRDEQFVDTAFWYIETDPDYVEKSSLKITSNTTRSRLNVSHKFTLTLNNPLMEADTSLIYFLEDSIQVFPTHFERSNLNRTFNVNYPFKAESQYIFKAKPGAFKDYFGDYSDTLTIPFSLQDVDFYGDLLVSISLSEKVKSVPGDKLLQLYTSKNKLITQRSFDNDFKTSFDQLDPGTYILKIVFDENGDGEWNTGEYAEKIQPEKLSIYPEEIKVRSNWDLEIEWEPSLPY